MDRIYREALNAHPDACAIVDPQGKIVTFAQFDQRIRATADWLADQGVTRGDRLAIWLINRPDWLVMLFSAARLGAIVLATNTRFRAHELQHILSQARVHWLVMQTGFRKLDFAAIVDEVDAGALPDLQHVIMLDASGDSPTQVLGKPVTRYPAKPWPPCASDRRHNNDQDHARGHRRDPHHGHHHGHGQTEIADTPELPVILFTTSGTTRGPKLVLHTQATLVRHSLAVSDGWQMKGEDNSLLAALPLCGVFGLNSALGALAAGIPIVMLDVFNADDANAALLRHRSSHLYATDEMLRRMADAWPTGRKAALKKVGFAAFSPGSSDLAQRMAPMGFPLLGLYGSSEVQALFSYQNPALPETERTLGGGRPVSFESVHVRARHPERQTLCAVGEAGELEISAATNFPGYLDNDEATRAAHTADGYFKTGDLGYVREDGSFVYLARMGDALRLGGFLVDPTEIEYALTRYAGVSAAQVVGLNIGGTLQPVAFVQSPDPAASTQAMRDALAAHVAPFKVPARIWMIDEFPSTASANGNKFQRVKLRDMALQRLSEEVQRA